MYSHAFQIMAGDYRKLWKTTPSGNMAANFLLTHKGTSSRAVCEHFSAMIANTFANLIVRAPVLVRPNRVGGLAWHLSDGAVFSACGGGA